MAFLTMSRNCLSASLRMSRSIWACAERRSPSEIPVPVMFALTMLAPSWKSPDGIVTVVIRCTSVRIEMSKPRESPPRASVATSVLWTSTFCSFASSPTTPRNVVSPWRRTPCDHTVRSPSNSVARTAMRWSSRPRTIPSAVGHDSSDASEHAGNSTSKRTRRVPLRFSMPSCMDASGPSVERTSTLSPPPASNVLLTLPLPEPHGAAAARAKRSRCGICSMVAAAAAASALSARGSMRSRSFGNDGSLRPRRSRSLERSAPSTRRVADFATSNRFGLGSTLRAGTQRTFFLPCRSRTLPFLHFFFLAAAYAPSPPGGAAAGAGAAATSATASASTTARRRRGIAALSGRRRSRHAPGCSTGRRGSRPCGAGRRRT